MKKYRKPTSGVGLLEVFLEIIMHQTWDMFMIFSRNIHKDKKDKQEKNIYPPVAYIFDGLVFIFLFALILPVLIVRVLLSLILKSQMINFYRLAFLFALFR